MLLLLFQKGLNTQKALRRGGLPSAQIGLLPEMARVSRRPPFAGSGYDDDGQPQAVKAWALYTKGSE